MLETAINLGASLFLLGSVIYVIAKIFDEVYSERVNDLNSL